MNNDIFRKIKNLLTKDGFGAFLVFLASLAVYLITLAPTVLYEDSGEFVTGAYTLGVLHPSGYPLYALLGKLFTFIPISNIAWRVNFMSAFFAALSAALLFLIINKIISSRKIAFGSSLIFAFSPVFWSQSIMAEVYTLNIFFLALIILLLLIWREKRENKYLHLFSLVFGLGICNHHIIALLGPVFALYIIMSDWRILKKVKTIIIMLLLFIVGLLPYLYLPVRAQANPPLNWGNPDTVERAWYHIARKQYSDVTIEQQMPWETKQKFIANFFSQLKSQFTLPLSIIGLFGLFFILINRKKLAIAGFLIFVLTSIGLILTLKFSYDANKIEVVRVFYLPAYFIFAVWIAYGLNKFIGYAGRFSQRLRRSLFVLAVFLPLLPLLLFFHQNNFSKNFIPYDFSKAILDTAGPNGIIFAEGDTTLFNLLYLQAVEGYRTDVQIYDHLGVVFENYYGYDYYRDVLTYSDKLKKKREAELKVIEKNYDQRPIYYLLDQNFPKDYSWLLVTDGILYRVEKNTGNPNEYSAGWPEYHIRGLDDDGVYKDFRTNEVAHMYREKLAQFHLLSGQNELAVREFEKIEASGGNIDSRMLNNIGLYYLNIQECGQALKRFNQALEKNPNEAAVYYNIALCQEKTGSWLEAATAYWAFINRWEGDFSLIEGAIDSLKSIEQYSWSNADLNNAGLKFMNNGKYDKALEYFELSKIKNPDEPGLYFNMGFTYEKLEEKQKAIESYEKFLQLWKSDDGYKKQAEEALTRLKK